MRRVINAINSKMFKTYIRLPRDDEAVQISKKFEEKCSLPQILGCIDGTHIPILPPADGYSDFLNRKGWPSVILQVVVDSNLK